tara:strand:+ start:4721 stop:6562 length:1842 start_codon:yes stop_codon:yes gene_type:complete
MKDKKDIKNLQDKTKSKTKENVKGDMLTTRLIRSFFKNHKVLIVFYIIIITLIIPVEIYLFPAQISKLFEIFSNIGVSRGISKLMKSYDIFIPITACLFLVMLLTLLKRYLENTIIPKFSIFTRKWIFEYIINENIDNHEHLPIGKIMSILSELPSSARYAMIVFLRNLFPYFVGFMFLTSYFFTFDKKIGILQLITLVLWISIFLMRSKKCMKVFEEAQDNVIDLYENIQDKFSNLNSIYSSQTENKEIKNHNKDENVNEKKYFNSLSCVFKTELYSNVLILISFIAFNILVMKLYKEQKLNVKAVSSLYIIEIYYWIIILRRVESNISEFIHSVGNINSIENFFSEMNKNIEKNKDNEKNEKNQKRNYDANFNENMKKEKTNVLKFDSEISHDKKVIEFEKVSFSYPGVNKTILDKVSFSIYQNDVVWIKGHSGSGKSTIFKIIMAYLKPNSGLVKIQGQNIQRINIQHIRDVITYVEQDTNLFDATVYDNIVYGNTQVNSQKIKGIIKKLDIRVFDKLSHGLNTKVGILGSNLSGGQKQIILLLRAYLRQDTKILLLDEPISAVDQDSVPEVLKLIQHMGNNKTVLMISHNSEVSSIVTKSIEITKFKKE